MRGRRYAGVLTFLLSASGALAAACGGDDVATLADAATDTTTSDVASEPPGQRDATADGADATIDVADALASEGNDGRAEGASDASRESEMVLEAGDAVVEPGDARDANTIGTLNFSIDPTLDTPDDAIKATSFTTASLLDTSGAVVTLASVSGASATFSLAGVLPGDYFVLVNGDTDDLVPTRIDDPTADVTQTVGQKLRASLIGPEAAPVYRINTWSAGQGESPVARFSDGTIIPNEQPYVILTLTTPYKIEIRVLGTAGPLTSFAPSGIHPYMSAFFESWTVRTAGRPQHGVVFQSLTDGGLMPGEDAAVFSNVACGNCHTSFWVKPTAYTQVGQSNGWCFHCHDGTGGDGTGFVDPTQ